MRQVRIVKQSIQEELLPQANGALLSLLAADGGGGEDGATFRLANYSLGLEYWPHIQVLRFLP